MPPRNAAKPETIRVRRPAASQAPEQIEHDPSEFLDRDVSFSRGQRMIIYVLGFCLACATGNAGGYVIALITWLVAHGSMVAKARKP